MKKILLFVTVLFVLSSCSDSLEERASKEAKEYTTKLCPTPYINNERTDSCVFDENTKTYIYYRTLRDKADNKEIIDKNHKVYRNALLHIVKDNTQLNAYKDAGFSFRYVFRSEKNGDVLIDETIGEKDY